MFFDTCFKRKTRLVMIAWSVVRATAVLILIGQDNIYYVDSRYSILLSIMTSSHAAGLDYSFLQPSSKMTLKSFTRYFSTYIKCRCCTVQYVAKSRYMNIFYRVE